MPQVLTTNALILCPHGAKGTTVPAHPKWTVNGGYVLVEGDTGVLSCPFLPLPCAGYTLQSMGLNATQIDGEKVILATDFNQTFTGLPLVMTEFHQAFDESTPAPLPAGQTSATPPPELADLVAPVVMTAVPYTPVPLTLHVDITNGWPGAVIAPQGGSWDTPVLTVTVAMPSTFLVTLAPGKYHFFLTAVSKRGLSGNADAVVEVIA
jgi:hypothetical protein